MFGLPEKFSLIQRNIFTVTPLCGCAFSILLLGDLSRLIFSECTTVPRTISLWLSTVLLWALRFGGFAWTSGCSMDQVPQAISNSLDKCSLPVWSMFISTSKSGFIVPHLNSVTFLWGSFDCLKWLRVQVSMDTGKHNASYFHILNASSSIYYSSSKLNSAISHSWTIWFLKPEI